MDEDDGQLFRELLPVDESYVQDEDEGGDNNLGLEQKGFLN